MPTDLTVQRGLSVDARRRPPLCTPAAHDDDYDDDDDGQHTPLTRRARAAARERETRADITNPNGSPSSSSYLAH